MPDRRRQVPRTDDTLADDRLAEPTRRLGSALVGGAVRAALDEVREGRLDPGDVVPHVLREIPPLATTMRTTVNATGVVLHTNMGRAPLSDAARAAVLAASATTDVEMDLCTGRRARRGRGALDALARAVPAADDVHVVNNGAAALVLAATGLAAGREVVIARGEMVEIGDGFRLPDLLVSTGARLREVGTTNRVTLADYADVIGPDTGMVLKVHPSNFVVSGFTGSVGVADLATLGVPVVHDIGSGLLHPHPVLPDEPDATTSLEAGADLVTASGDKLLGGPQAGLVLGRADLVATLRRHPLARALRVDKLTLAALEATVAGPPSPVALMLAADSASLLRRAEDVAAALVRAGVDADARRTSGVVGGGGAPGVVLPSAAVTLPARMAETLRLGAAPVVGTVSGGRCVLDLLTVPPGCDEDLTAAVVAASRPDGG